MKTILYELLNKKINAMQRIYLTFLRRVNIQVRRKSRQFNSFLLKNTGYNFSQFSDAFSVSCLLLILIKLVVRINGYNTIWQFNFVVLFLGTLFSLRLNLIVFVRESLISFWKWALGERFYFHQIVDFYLVDLSHKDALLAKNIPHYSFFNIFFQQIYFFLILIRIFIINEFYAFILLNFLLTYFLLSNHFFLLSSFFSIFFTFSKFTFHLSDYSISIFNSRISLLIKNERNESLKPTYENARFVGVVISRFFYASKAGRTELSTSNKLWEMGTSLPYVIDKLELMEHKLIKILIAQHVGEENDPTYKNLLNGEASAGLKKSTKNTLIGPILLCLLIGFILQVSLNLNVQELGGIKLRFVKLPKNLFSRASLAKNPSHTKYSSPKAKGHPEVAAITEENQVITTNLSTMHTSDETANYLRKVPYGIVDGKLRAVVCTGTSYEANADAKRLLDECETASEKIIEILNTKNPVFINNQIQEEYFRKATEIERENLFLVNKILFSNISTNEPDIMTFFTLIVYDPRFSSNDIKEALKVRQAYSKYVQENDYVFNEFFTIINKYRGTIEGYSKMDNAELQAPLKIMESFFLTVKKNAPYTTQVEIYKSLAYKQNDETEFMKLKKKLFDE